MSILYYIRFYSIIIILTIASGVVDVDAIGIYYTVISYVLLWKYGKM